MNFPVDDYTAHGYLDLPDHTRSLNPQGVLRSHGAGYRWHYPAYAGMYGGRQETYRAGFRLALNGDADPERNSPYHTKNLHRLELGAAGAAATAEFHPVGADALRATVRVRGAGRARLTAVMEYARTVSANGEWGESGLTGRAAADRVELQSFEAGDAIVLWASRPAADAGVTTDAARAASWTREPAAPPPDGFQVAPGQRGDRVELHAALSVELDLDAGDAHAEFILARGKTLERARAALAAARRDAPADRARRLAEDDAFWARAPRLEGDWPAHFRRGLVYDLETLRMMVKRPIGEYRHAWDAMQIHAPRVVLAEAAIDALLLAYADPETAQAMLLGVLEDASAANVPCSREDGTFNMVAADGTVCGTGPQWGYPFLVAARLHAMRPDRAWLEATYARLAEYLRWWLAHRRGPRGTLHFACSWESGQDDSPRFGEQPLGGGHPVRHVRPVDLHASVAHAARVLERFATTLGRDGETPEWAAVNDEFTRRTDELWHDERYADFDERANAFTVIDDVMQLAPYALGVAETSRLEAGAERVRARGERPEVWPCFAWTAVDAAARLGLHDHAAALAWGTADRAYRFWDARTHDPERTLPGIACEYWPEHGRCSGEGYGWGAFNVHLVLHTLLGFHATETGASITPNVPAAWRVPGRRYAARLTHHDHPVHLELLPRADGRVTVRANDAERVARWGERLDFTDADVTAAHPVRTA